MAEFTPTLYEARTCGDPDCKEWHITTTAGEIVKLDEIQARTCVVILNQLNEQQLMWAKQLAAEAGAVLGIPEPTIDGETDDDEIRVVRKLVEDAIAKGCMVTVNDCYEGRGEDTVKLSKDVKQIMAALRTTDGDRLRFYTPGGAPMGWVALVYGNAPWEVIQDHVDSLAIRDLLKGAEALGAEMEAAQ